MYMEQLTTVHVEYNKIVTVDTSGFDLGNGTYGLYVFNETYSDYVFGFSWEEIEMMSDQEVLDEIKNLREQYLYECVQKRNGFYRNEHWISLDDI